MQQPSNDNLGEVSVEELHERVGRFIDDSRGIINAYNNSETFRAKADAVEFVKSLVEWLALLPLLGDSHKSSFIWHDASELHDMVVGRWRPPKLFGEQDGLLRIAQDLAGARELARARDLMSKGVVLMEPRAGTPGYSDMFTTDGTGSRARDLSITLPPPSSLLRPTDEDRNSAAGPAPGSGSA